MTLRHFGPRITPVVRAGERDTSSTEPRLMSEGDFSPEEIERIRKELLERMASKPKTPGRKRVVWEFKSRAQARIDSAEFKRKTGHEGSKIYDRDRGSEDTP